MSIWLSAAVRLTKAWTAAYTAGLAGELKQARRSEIESDLWEQRRHARFDGQAPAKTATLIFYRLAAGVPADLSWRLEARSFACQEGEDEVNDSLTERCLLVVCLAFAALPILFGASHVAGVGGGGPIWGTAILVAGLVLALGVFLSGMRHPLAMRLTVMGVVAVCLLTFWMFFITIPVGLGLIAFARSRRSWPTDATAA